MQIHLYSVNVVDGCTKCGRCCSNLRIGDETSGLTLFTDEVHLFPEETIKPHLGKGANEPTSIFTYQHTENVCIHLVDNLCKIYEERPLMCRSFPVKLGINGLRFSPGCKAVLNSLRNSKTMDRELTEVKATIETAERLSEFHQGFRDDEAEWKYNLVSEQWEPMSY